MEKILIHKKSKKGDLRTSEQYALFSSAWTEIRREIETRRNEISGSIFQDMLSFIKRTDGECFSPTSQIPTALLLAGANTPDHQTIYGHILKYMASNMGYAALVNTGSETISSRSLITSIVRQVTGGGGINMAKTDHGSTYDSENETHFSNCLQSQDPEELADDFMKQFTPSVRCTYWALSEWYYNTNNKKNQKLTANTRKPTGSAHSRRSMSQSDLLDLPTSARKPRNTIHSRTNQPVSRPRRFTSQTEVHSKTLTENTSDVSTNTGAGPIVIILPQVESIPSHVLQEFIELTAMFVSGQATSTSRALPIRLVLALSTPPEIGFECRLNAATLAKLKVEQFTVPPPALYLDSLLNTLIEFPGFHLTHTMCSYLVDSLFLCLDYSVHNFLRRLQ